jgi:hypothetical protein
MVYGCTRERVSIDGEYSGKIFDTDLSVVPAIYIQWRLPGLGSRVAVTQCLNLLRMRQPLSIKGSKDREYLTVPKNQRKGRYRLSRYSIILLCFQRRSKARVRTKCKMFPQDRTNSFGRYSYRCTLASEYGDEWGTLRISNPVSCLRISMQSSQM